MMRPCRGQQLKGMGDAEVLAHMNNPRGTSPVKQGWYHNPGPTVPAGVYRHADRLGAGAKKRHGLEPKQKVEAVMHEFGRGTLRSGGSGAHVTNRKQAIAIAMSEAGMERKHKKGHHA
jgi:hypothetical protein